MDVGPWAADSSLVNVVVETPAGSRNKFRFDEKRGLFLLHKVLPAGTSFPFDFGFVPGTRAEDGDPLDVLLLGEEATFTGCLVTVRLLGSIEARQTEKGSTIRNDRLIGTPETPKIKPRARTLGDLPARLLDQIEHFFVAYNEFEGRRFVPFRRGGPKAAEKRVERAAAEYRESRRGRGRRDAGATIGHGRSRG
jgi:inorganic pyrophosphatase